MKTKNKNLGKSVIESLEARIAPAALVTYPKPIDAKWLPLPLGTPVELFAGQGLSTLGDKKGSYLLFVEQGSAIVFTQDLDGDNTFDANEITGISAGDGLRLISFVDIHGDIVTNLKVTTVDEIRNGLPTVKRILSLSDSDNNPANDVAQGLKGDGRVLLNNTIEKIELRPLLLEDLVDQTGDGAVTNGDLELRQPPKSSYSIYGSIYAGRGFGADDGGLIFNPSGVDSLGNLTQPAPTNFLPSVDSIRIGTAVNGQYFSFGVSGEYRIGNQSVGDNLSGLMSPFVPASGAAGGSINMVKSLGDTAFNINFLVAGNGGAGGAGGNISNVAMFSDDTGGYQLLAGNGGTGRTGGSGGSILNFSDVGSQTGLVVLSGGDGGTGTIGSGGTAGDSAFANINIKGNVHIDMGDGGNGFVNGGGGASLATGVFTEPVPILTKTLNGWGTTHLPDSSSGGFNSRLGVTAGIDFNGDGEGDLVYATSDASQIVVMISDPTPDTDPADTGFMTFSAQDGLPIQGIYLSGPRNAKALSIGDVNGDGHPDIVAASRDFGGTGDLQVMLCKYEDLNNDGILSSDEDLNRNGTDDFLGFYEPRHSTIPFFGNHAGSGGRLVIPEYNEFGVNDLTIGDFNGDGVPEIAVGAYELAVFMQPDFELNPVTGEKEYTGQFFYDYGRKTANVDGVNYPAQVKESYFDTNAMFVSSAITFGPGFPYFPVVLEASTLNNVGETRDVLLVSAWSYDAVATLDWSDDNRLFGGVPVSIGQFELGGVDLLRGLPPVNFQPFRLYDFTAVDFDSDGDTDVAAISLDSGTHSGFMNGSVGTGFGSGFPGSGSGQEAGNYFAAPNNGHRSMYTIRAVDLDGVGGVNDLVMSHEIGGAFAIWAEGPDAAATGYFIPPGFTSVNDVTTNDGDQGGNETNHAFADPYVTDITSATPTHIIAFGMNDAYAVEQDRPYAGRIIFDSLVEFADPVQHPNIPFLEYSLSISAGNGGHALIGKGGVGGFIGGASTLEPLVDDLGAPVLDPVTNLPASLLNGAIKITPTVTVQIQSGIGGDGFSSGGNGGTIQGVAIFETEGTFLNRFLNHRFGGGDGGRGVFGTGGTGGSLISNSVWGGVEFIAGDGGVGKVGGNGGSVVGNGGTYDVYNSSVAVIAGDGGLGSASGGSGGSIAGFSPRLPDPRIGGSPSATLPVDPGSTVPALLRHFLYYSAGDGGSAVTGRGGNGGNVSNSSPTIGVQLLGELIVSAGDGGIGNSGGNGGSISDFAIRPDGGSGSGSNDYFPKLVTLLAGKGGDAFAGKGGNGGNLVNLDVIGKGSDSVGTNTIQSVYRVYEQASRFQFNRLIAGAAGSSSGNDGGNGGKVDNVIAFSPAGSFAIIGGAAGDGLRKGGAGGSVLNLRIDIGNPSVSKALIAAGEGGDASAFVPNPSDFGTPNQGLNAFGGKVGKGGNGGSVLGVTQQGGRAAQMDIIAGDGGSTVNYGTARDGKKGFVGVGGSIKEVHLTADLGNNSEFVALRSYNDVLNGESFGDFVQSDLVSQSSAIGAGLVALDDSLGNVGVIVGAAGRNKSVVFDRLNNPTIYRSVPSQAGINGSLENVTALNLVVAVAGSVDRIASIQAYKNVLITNNTGGNKTPRIITIPGGVPTIIEDYADQFGIPTTSHKPELDGILVDGAIVAKRFLDARGRNVPAPLNGVVR